MVENGFGSQKLNLAQVCLYFFSYFEKKKIYIYIYMIYQFATNI